MNQKVISRIPAVTAYVLVAAGLYSLSLYSYLLFHSVAEIFSVVIAGTIFIIGWNSRKYIQNNYLLFISVPYLFIACLDTLHTLSYVGMGIFKDYEYYANQVWIATRYLESITLLLAFFALRSDKKINVVKLFWVYLAVSTVIVLSIFVYKIFPVCFVAGKGLTPFKVYSEYIICVILAASIFLLYRNKSKFSEKIYRYLFISLLATIATELAFTIYVSNYDLSNLVGHYLKIVSCYYVYKSIVQTGLESPQSIIFKELNDTRDELMRVNNTKDRLISVLAHDLRGPVGSLYRLFQDVNEYPDYDNPESNREIMELALHSLATVSDMLDNTLDWVRLQREMIKPEFSVEGIKGIIEDAVSPLRLLAKEKNIEIVIDIEDGLKIEADKELARVVIRNIVNNALKFCHAGCAITITAESEAETLCLKITDNGPGIDEKIAGRIFSIEKADIAHIPNSGTGLGLGICRDFMALNRGRMSVASAIGQGTRISLFFRHRATDNI